MSSLERKINWLIVFVVLLCALFCTTSVGLAVVSLSFLREAETTNTNVRAITREETISMIWEELYAPLLDQLRALAEHGDDIP